MRLVMFILASIVVFGSCYHKKPEYILNREEMVKVLADLQIIQSSSHFLGGDSLANTHRDYILFVLKKHNITEQQLKQSNEYYSKHPSVYKNIMKEVLDYLEAMRDEEVERDSALYNIYTPSSMNCEAIVNTLKKYEHKDSIFF